MDLSDKRPLDIKRKRQPVSARQIGNLGPQVRMHAHIESHGPEIAGVSTGAADAADKGPLHHQITRGLLPGQRSAARI